MYTKELGSSNIELRRGDITTVAADAIVNAANSALAPGAGVCGAILRAGGLSIFDECARIGGCPTGSAVITAGGTLPAKHVIHAVAPRYSGRASDAELLRSAYASSLRIAQERSLTSIAFPSLGTGVYGYPIEEAARIALDAAITHLQSHSGIERVIFVLFSEHDRDVFARALAQADK
jgi:O-acetyl-ADP-ribose deacetylase (regulator of RNase III)